MDLNVRLQVFEGPLDLLLYLIEKNKVNIYDIPIARITDQYMEYVAGMEKSSLGILSEFLVMAATLLEIKSQMLLPKEEEKEEDEEDPRADLVRQLLEYKMYKAMAQELKDMSIEASHRCYRKPMIPDEVRQYVPPVDMEALVGNVNLEKLRSILDDVLKRQSGRTDPLRSRFGRIRKEEISLDSRLSGLESYAKKHRSFSFRQIISASGDREEIIVTFLAVLELIRTGKITISQEKLFDDILIESKEQQVNETEAIKETDENGGDLAASAAVSEQGKEENDAGKAGQE